MKGLDKIEKGLYTHRDNRSIRVVSVNHESLEIAKAHHVIGNSGWVIKVDRYDDVTRQAFKKGEMFEAENLEHAITILNGLTRESVNLRTGDVSEIPLLTPRYCDPSSEAYWSM